ncbi:hypothetical protein MW887_004618 [Aspergillus wentii]|nr:hypothetical protein MW887_004618 [Aspergillus wentii]
MADFSEYGIPIEEWIALEATLPVPPTGLGLDELKKAMNSDREATAAKEMIDQDFVSRVTIRDHHIPGRDGYSIEGRTYRPSNVLESQSLPVYIHLHGGGFFVGTLSSEDATCSRIVTSLAEENFPVVVLNINYRHTPEYPFPIAWNDTEDAFHWLHDNIDQVGGDSSKIVVGGISAGALLTASLALIQNLGIDESLAKRPKIRGQILMIPPLVIGDAYETQLKQLVSPEVSSYRQNEFAPILPVARMQLFSKLMGVDKVKIEDNDRRVNPGNATADEVKGLPPAVFGIAGRDPLRDEGLFYGKLLTENGVPTKVNVFKGLPHGFRRYGDKLSLSKKYDEVMYQGIKWALSEPEATGKFDIQAH